MPRIECCSKPRLAGCGLLLLRSMPLSEFDSSTFSEKAKCFAKVLAEMLLDKPEAISSCSTGMALVESRLLVRHNRKGRSGVIVEWTEAHVLAAARLQGDELANERGQIGCIPHPFYFISSRHSLPSSPPKRHPGRLASCEATNMLKAPTRRTQGDAESGLS